MSYYILDKSGNFITEYKTTLEIAKTYNVAPSSFISCANSISNLIKDKKYRGRKRLSTKNVVCVKKEDYVNHLDKIIWILTKDDIIVIDKTGNIVNTYKTMIDAANILTTLNKKIFHQSGIGKVLNINKEYHGYRFVTREHYLETVKEDPLYYSKESKKDLGKKRVPVDMYNFKTGKFIKSFNSQTEAAKYMGCTKECIRLSIKNGHPILKTDYYFIPRNKN